MPDLLIINPGGSRRIYQGLSDTLTGVEPPLWCRLIAGYCRDRGHDVAIWDAEVDPLPPVDAPKLICIAAYGHQPSASTQSMEWVTRFVREYRNNLPPIIVVGGHAAAMPEQTVDETGAYVCNSEGPVTVERLLAGDDFRTIPGLCWLDYDGNYRANPAPPLLDVKELHGNAWDLLPMDRYRAHNWQCFDGSPRQPYASIYTSLGCPYKCSFCCINAPFRSNRYRMRDPADVVAEVAMLYRNYAVRTFKITDEMFVLNERHYTAIAEGLAALPFAHELNIWAYARVDTVKPDTLALLRKAGIRWLCLGIESGSAHVRDGSRKTIDETGIMDAVKAIQAADINVLGNFIFGLPDDTMESMRATFDLAVSLECEYSNFYSAMAYPGSRLFDEAAPNDLPATWGGYSQHSFDTTPLPTATVSGRDVLRFRDDAFRRYFTDPAYLDRIHRKFGDHAVREIEKMTAHDLERVA